IRFDGRIFAPATPRQANDAGIAFIHQELNLFHNMSVVDNLYIHDCPRLKWLPFIHQKKRMTETDDLLAKLQLKISPHALIEDLQPGERQMIEICKALRLDAKLIIFDEPTTSLTARETEFLFKIIRQLQENGITIIYISHILKDVSVLCDRVVVLRDGRVVDQGDRHEMTIERMITSMCGCDLRQLYPPKTMPVGEEIRLDVTDLSCRGVVDQINLRVRTGEIVGLFGLMGSGRTELARLIFGLEKADGGVISLDGRNVHATRRPSVRRQKVAFVTENRREEGLMMEASISENMALASLSRYRKAGIGLLDQHLLQETVAEQAALLKIKGERTVFTPVKNLSGGNQQKVVIGKWLLTHPQMIILDEPTRGIDVGAKFEVYTIILDLAAKGAGILFISSELEELMGMCDVIVVMRQGVIVAEFDRNAFNERLILQAAFGAE
ncbi:MAG: sugar ABC transporter ATP-binding protein, partial [Calditrichaeota bacterium]